MTLPIQCPKKGCRAIPQPAGKTMDGRVIWRCGQGHTGLCRVVRRAATLDPTRTDTAP